jgi:hypothetical protein
MDFASVRFNDTLGNVIGEVSANLDEGLKVYSNTNNVLIKTNLDTWGLPQYGGETGDVLVGRSGATKTSTFNSALNFIDPNATIFAFKH